MTMITGGPPVAPAGRRSGSTGEGAQQGLALLGPEAPHATGVADADVFHRPPGLDLAHAGQGLEHRDDLHLPDDVVAFGLVEQLAEVERPHLEALLQLGACSTGL